jgi:hypothetical protein
MLKRNNSNDKILQEVEEEEGSIEKVKKQLEWSNKKTPHKKGAPPFLNEQQ